MARNRKRAKTARRTQPVGAGSADRAVSASPETANGAPDPLEHASPDAELAEAQLAVGRGEPVDEIDTPEEERELEELATGSDAAISGPRRGGGGRRAGELAGPAASGPPAHRVSAFQRLLTFLRGSWAELQRVQWPDRRQVMQATSVVIGFVIVAGVFLGVADWAAAHIMDWILK